MTGGLFGKPFVLNEKCIVFSLLCMTLFLYKPMFENSYMKYLTLFIIFVVAYVTMVWYDYYFNCDIVPLRRSSGVSFTQQFKPSAHVPDKQEKGVSTNLDKKRKRILIYGLHLFIIVPFLLYILYITRVMSTQLFIHY
jgi:hypothetical protein